MHLSEIKSQTPVSPRSLMFAIKLPHTVPYTATAQGHRESLFLKGIRFLIELSAIYIWCNHVSWSFLLSAKMDDKSSSFCSYRDRSNHLAAAIAPWNIAIAATLAIIGASPLGDIFAFHLYLTPVIALLAKGRSRFTSEAYP
jgi:hypothetical protein